MRLVAMIGVLAGCTTTVEPGVLRALSREEPGSWRMVEGANGNSFRLDAVTVIRVKTIGGWLPSRRGYQLRISDNHLLLDDFRVPWVDIEKIEVMNAKPAWPFSLAPIAIAATRKSSQFMSGGAKPDFEEDNHVTAADPGNSSEGVVPHYVLDGWERRRGLYGMQLSSEVGTAFRGKEGFFQDVALTLRIYGLVDVGGGYRHVFASAGGSEIVSRHLGFGRAGAHLPFDEGRRASIGILFDVGGGSQTDIFVRIGWGIRVRLFDEAHLSLYPLNPVYTRFARQPGLNELPVTEWRVPSSLELSFIF
jgi:hypothetical protein